MRLRRLTTSLVVCLIVSLAIGTAVNAATPPQITVDSPTLSANEGQTATIGGTFTETDGDAVTLSTSTGTIGVDPDDATRWIWTKAILDGPATTIVTVTATDTDGPTNATFTLTSVNVPPVASTTGPKYVPVASASDRVFGFTASDVAADTLTNVVDCGSGTVKATTASTIRCSFPVATTTLVGVRSTDKDGATTDGRITVRASANIASVADSVIEINGAPGNDQLGGALAAPDLNDDGKADVAIGGTTTTSGSVADPAYVMVVFGRATFGVIGLGSLSASAGIRIDGPAGVGFGRTLASAGDINGDGIDDLLIGAEDGASGKGIVYVVFGSATLGNLDVTTMSAGQGATITGSAAAGLTGHALAGVGDVNGDAKADIAVGSPGLSSGAGGVDILFGGTTFTNVDLASLGSRGVHISGAGAGSGSSLAGGDINGDTRSDVVIGAKTGVGSNATVIYGQTSMTDLDASTLTSGQGFRIGGDETLGITAVGVGDMDHDGFGDVVILHPDFTWAASVVRGASTNASIPHLVSASRTTVLRILESHDPLGEDLAVFDADHDSRADVLIGANADVNNGAGSGSAFLVRGTATLTDVDLSVLDARWTRVDGDNPDAFAGDAVAGGDVSGDGIMDPIVGAPGATTWAGDSLPGRVGVFFGKLPDTSPPVVSNLAWHILVGTKLSGSSPIVHSTCAGSDFGTGIEHFDIALQTDGGSWVTVGSAANCVFDRALASGHDYRFRVRAFDNAANFSAYVMGSTFHITGYQDSTASVKYSGTWKVGHSTSYAGGTTRYASTANKTASLTFTGRQVVVAAPTGPTRGSAKIYINGVYSKTISLFSSTAQASTVLGTWSWSTSATRTIMIKIVGTSGHARVDVDRILVVK